MPTDIRPCTCQHSYQDEKYGRGMRVHNTAKVKGSSGTAYVCTVCGRKVEGKSYVAPTDDDKAPSKGKGKKPRGKGSSGEKG